MSTIKPSDNIFLGITITLVVFGIFMFLSAALGILARDEKTFFGLLTSQLVLGLILGMTALYVGSRINYKFWRTYSLYIFIGTILLTAAVHIPGLGYAHGGAKRWIDLPFFSFQPAELLKIGFIFYFASFLAWVRSKTRSTKDVTVGFLPLILGVGGAIGALISQPDTKSIILMMAAGVAMILVAEIPWKWILGVLVIGAIGFSLWAMMQPYVLERIKTFVNPSSDLQGAGYQVEQSLIAIGSGGVFGHGYGQGIQKFRYLPEPHGDSIFAVIGEELGFIGATIIVLLFLAFGLRGMRIAHRAPDTFSRLLVTGLIAMIIAQSFLNIASLVGLFPLTGVPLVFISHGGTSLLFSLFAVGVILNVSRSAKK